MTHLPNLELITHHASTLFIHDNNNRLTFVNETVDPTSYPAPLVYIGCTNQGLVWRFRADLPAPLCQQIDTFLHAVPPKQAVGQYHNVFKRIQEILQAAYPQLASPWLGPAYYAPQPGTNLTKAIPIHAANAHVLQRHFPFTFAHLAALQPCTAIVLEDHAVAICRTVRRSKTAVEAGVDTIPAMQQQGFGAQVVAKWVALIHKLNLIPMYSTSHKNIASQNLAAKLGLVQYGLDFHLSTKEKSC